MQKSILTNREKDVVAAFIKARFEYLIKAPMKSVTI